MKNDDGTEGYSQIYRLRPRTLELRNRFDSRSIESMRCIHVIPYCDFCERFIKNRMSDEDFHEVIVTTITEVHLSRFPTALALQNLCEQFDLPYANSCALCEVFIQGRVPPKKFYEVLSRVAGHQQKDGSTWGCLGLIVVAIGAVLYWLLN